MASTEQWETVLNIDLPKFPPDSTGAERNGGLFRLCCAIAAIYSDLPPPSMRIQQPGRDNGGRTPWHTYLSSVTDLCFQLLLRMALARPALVAAGKAHWADLTSRDTASMNDTSLGIGELATNMSRPYFLKQLLGALRHSTRQRQLLAASHLLLLATRESSDDHTELLSVGAASDGTEHAIRVVDTVECCLRRLWPAPSGESVSQERQSPLEGTDEAASITQNLCQVLTSAAPYSKHLVRPSGRTYP